MADKRILDNGEVRWDARWRDSAGRQRKRSFPTKREAERAEREGRKKAEDTPRRAEGRERLTVADWAEQWLDLVASRVRADGISPTTARGYESHVRLYLKPILGETRLLDLTAGDVMDLCAEIIGDGERKPSTAANVKRTLSTMLSEAGYRELVDRNAAKLAKTPSSSTPPPRAFDAEEVTAIIEGLENSWYREVFRFMSLTGLRASEICGLKWKNVDLDEGLYTVTTLHRITGSSSRVLEPGVYEGKGKSAASRAETELAEPAVELLREHRRHQLEVRLAAEEWPREDLVFTTTVGTPIRQDNLRRALAQACSNAGVELDGRQPLHAFRKSFATVLLEEGVPLHLVVALGRWAGPQVLMQNYAAAHRTAKRKALEKAFG